MKANSALFYSMVLITLALQSFFIVSTVEQTRCEFAILIPSFNNEKYYEENLHSACWQNSTNPYHIYYVDDASTDSTGRLVDEYVKKHQLEDKVTVIHNEKNLGAGANTYNTIHKYISDHKIVVILDGDDKFPHNNVLKTLEKYYSDPEIWMTYGVLETFPEKQLLVSEVFPSMIKENRIRKDAWACALRTFKASLFKKIRLDSFYYKGEFMRVTHDLAFSLAMLEMCISKNAKGRNHSAFTKEVLYLYRTNTPINDFRIRGELQREVDRYIRTLEPYEALLSLEDHP